MRPRSKVQNIPMPDLEQTAAQSPGAVMQTSSRQQRSRQVQCCRSRAAEKIYDYWKVDGDRYLSDTWKGFTRFTILDEKPPDGFAWSGERLTRKQTTSRPDSLWPEIWKDMSEASKRREKQKWAIEQPKLDNARNCVVFTSLIQQMKNKFKGIMKHARRKVEDPTLAAMPCRTRRGEYRETCSVLDNRETK